MRPTIDMRRRKSPVTLDRILKLQLDVVARTGKRDARLLLRLDQQEDFYCLLQHQVCFSGDLSEVSGPLRWNSLEVVAR